MLKAIMRMGQSTCGLTDHEPRSPGLAQQGSRPDPVGKNIDLAASSDLSHRRHVYLDLLSEVFTGLNGAAHRCSMPRTVGVGRSLA
jgi:hypothetical protein